MARRRTRYMRVTRPDISGRKWRMTEPSSTALDIIMRRGSARYGSRRSTRGDGALRLAGRHGGVGVSTAGSAGGVVFRHSRSGAVSSFLISVPIITITITITTMTGTVREAVGTLQALHRTFIGLTNFRARR